MKKRLMFAALIVVVFIFGWCARQERLGQTIFATGRSNAVISWYGTSNVDSVRQVLLPIVRQEPQGLLCRMGQNFLFVSWKKPKHAIVNQVVEALRRNGSPGFEFTVARYDDGYEAFNPETLACH